MRRSRNLIALLIALLFGQSAYAATLTATPTNGTEGALDRFLPGASVAVTLQGTTQPYSLDGITPPDAATDIDVRIETAGHGGAFGAVSIETGRGGSCFSAQGCQPGASWAVDGTQGTTVSGNYIAFLQVGGGTPGPLTNNMTPAVYPSSFDTGQSSLTSLFTLTAPGAPGTYSINLVGYPNDPVGWFEINGPQTVGSYTVVPEPTTAALMVLGLLGMTCGARRR